MRESADVTLAIRKIETIRWRVLAALRTFKAKRIHPTAQEIAYVIGHPFAAATVTAKLRELRRPDHGGHVIACRRCSEEEQGNGYIYRYELIE